MFYVYILKSLKNGRFYTGQTSNLEKRLKEHNEGRSKYTKLTKPFTLVHNEKHKTRALAMKREKFLKSGQGREWTKNNFE